MAIDNPLYEKYKKEIVPKLMETFKYKSIMQVPKLTKIVLNMGIGEATKDPKVIDHAVEDLRTIAGQHPVRTKAKKAIANFNLKKGMEIGVKVTLRRQRMWDFLYKLIMVALPRVRDFKGLPTRSFDGRGNYSFGIKEQIIFPEIDYDKIDRIRGLDVTIVTSAKTDEEAKTLLELLGFPFRR